jgi:hypothetical protein
VAVSREQSSSGRSMGNNAAHTGSTAPTMPDLFNYQAGTPRQNPAGPFPLAAADFLSRLETIYYSRFASSASGLCQVKRAEALYHAAVLQLSKFALADPRHPLYRGASTRSHTSPASQTNKLSCGVEILARNHAALIEYIQVVSGPVSPPHSRHRDPQLKLAKKDGIFT